MVELQSYRSHLKVGFIGLGLGGNGKLFLYCYMWFAVFRAVQTPQHYT